MLTRDEHRRHLKIFLCHSSDDKATVRELYLRLRSTQGMQPWLDEKDLFPGQDWDLEIRKAVKDADVIIVCLSAGSINKRGYVQKEIRHALDVADEQPEGAIFLIPLKLEECEVPQRLRNRQWVNYFEPDGQERLMSALRRRAEETGVSASKEVQANDAATLSVRRDLQGTFRESDERGQLYSNASSTGVEITDERRQMILSVQPSFQASGGYYSGPRGEFKIKNIGRPIKNLSFDWPGELTGTVQPTPYMGTGQEIVVGVERLTSPPSDSFPVVIHYEDALGYRNSKRLHYEFKNNLWVEDETILEYESHTP